MAYRRTGLSSQAFLRPSAHAMTRSWASNLRHDAVGGLVFAALRESEPAVAIKILAGLGRELSGRLRRANRTIHQLEA